MGHFVYKYQPILSVKRQLEDLKLSELGKAVIQYEEEKAQLDLLDLQKEQCLNDMKSATSDSLNVLKLIQYNSFISLLKDKKSLQTNKVKDAEINMEQRRQEMVVAHIEAETYEKLKQKQKNEHTISMLKKEQIFVDEITGYAFNVKSIGGENG